MVDSVFLLVPFAFRFLTSPLFGVRALAVLDVSFALGRHMLGSKEYWRGLTAASGSDFLLGQDLHA
jgi:hypothetical protein